MSETAVALKKFFVAIPGHGVTALVGNDGTRRMKHRTTEQYQIKQHDGTWSPWYTKAEIESRGLTLPTNKKEVARKQRIDPEFSAERFEGCVIPAEHYGEAKDLYKQHFKVKTIQEMICIEVTDDSIPYGPADRYEVDPTAEKPKRKQQKASQADKPEAEMSAAARLLAELG